MYIVQDRDTKRRVYIYADSFKITWYIYNMKTTGKVECFDMHALHIHKRLHKQVANYEKDTRKDITSHVLQINVYLYIFSAT